MRYHKDSPIYRIAWLPDGRKFVTDGEDSLIRVWDAAEGRVVLRFDPGVGALEDLALTPDGRLVMAVGASRVPGAMAQNVTLCHLGTGRIEDRGSWPDPLPAIHPIAACPRRRLVAIATPKDGIRLLDAWNGAEVGRLETGDQKVQSLLFSADGKRLCAASQDYARLKFDMTYRIFDLEGKREPQVIRARGSAPTDLAFSPDSRTLAVSYLGEATTLYEIDTGRAAPLGQPYLAHLAYSADGRALAGVDGMGVVKVFDPSARSLVSSSLIAVGRATEAALSPDGRTLLSVGEDQVLHAWEIGARRDRYAMPDAHAGPIESISVAEGGRTIFTGGKDGSLRLWDAATGKPVRKFSFLFSSANGAAVSPDGRRVAAAMTLNHLIAIWDLPAHGDPLVLAYAVGLGVDRPLALHFLDAETLVLVDAIGRTFRFDIPRRRVAPGVAIQLPKPAKDDDLDAATFAMMASLDLAQAAFLPGGKRLVARGHFNGLHLVDLSTGKAIRPLGEGDRVAASPDGRTLAIADIDAVSDEGKPKRLNRQMGGRSGHEWIAGGSDVRLVEVETDRVLQRIRVEGSAAWALAFSPDSKTLAVTSGWDSGEIQLFEAETGRRIRAIASPPTRTPALAFTPDGTRLVTGMADGSALVWDLRPVP